MQTQGTVSREKKGAVNSLDGTPGNSEGKSLGLG